MASTHHPAAQHSRYPLVTPPNTRDEFRLPSLKDLNFQYQPRGHSAHESPQHSTVGPVETNPNGQDNLPRHVQSWNRSNLQAPSPPAIPIHHQHQHQHQHHQPPPHQQHTPPLSAGHEPPSKVEYASKQDNGGFLTPGMPLSAQSTPVPGSLNIGPGTRNDELPHGASQVKRRRSSANMGAPRDVRTPHTGYPPQYASYPPSQPQSLPPPGSYQQPPQPAHQGHSAPAPQEPMHHHPVPVPHPTYNPYQPPPPPQYMHTRTHPQHPPHHQPQPTHGNPYPSPGPPPAPPPQVAWEQPHHQQPPPQHHPHPHHLPPPPPPPPSHAQHAQPTQHPHHVPAHQQPTQPFPPQHSQPMHVQHQHQQHQPHPPPHPPPPPHHSQHPQMHSQPQHPQTQHPHMQHPQSQRPPPQHPQSHHSQPQHPQIPPQQPPQMSHPQPPQQPQQPQPPQPQHQHLSHPQHQPQPQLQHQPQQPQQVPFARTTAIVPTNIDTRVSYAVSEPDQRQTSARDSTMSEIVKHCTALYAFASHYAQLQASLPEVQPSASELAEMSQRAIQVVRLLEEYRRLNFPEAERTKFESVTASPDDHRPPKRPWEDISQDGNTVGPETASYSEQQQQQYPTPVEKAQTTAEQDMEIIRTKRATSAAGGTGTAGQPKSKYRKRSSGQRATPPGKCHSCNIRETPEWRRGPDGARTLCNACGLHYAKLMRKRDKAGGNGDAPRIDMDTLRASARAAELTDKSHSRSKASRSQQSIEPTSPMEAGKPLSQQHHQGSFQLVQMMPQDLAPPPQHPEPIHVPPPQQSQHPHASMAQNASSLSAAPPSPWATNPPSASASGARGYAPEQIQHQSFMRTSQHPTATHTSPR